MGFVRYRRGDGKNHATSTAWFRFSSKEPRVIALLFHQFVAIILTIANLIGRKEVSILCRSFRSRKTI